MVVSGLDGERQYHFAIQSSDQAGNTSPLSPSVSAETLPVPPGTITDLVATATDTGVVLRWTAPGDDGKEGTATAYDIRLSQARITALTFDQADNVSGPVPSAADTQETLRLESLESDTQYFFAIKAKDDKDAWSAISNVASVQTRDRTAPGAIAAFTGDSPSGNSSGDGITLSPVETTASSSLGQLWSPFYASDDRVSTAWSSAPVSPGEAVTLTLDLGVPHSTDRIRLRADNGFAALFPGHSP